MPIAPDDIGGPAARIPGDFERNSVGRPWVIDPTGKRRLYDRPSGFWPFDDYTGVDPIYSTRGTFVHKLCEHACNGDGIPTDYMRHGADDLGISLPLQACIVTEWAGFRSAIGLEAVAVEATVVNDVLRVAGTTDRVDRLTKPLEASFVALPAGALVGGDIKTGSKVVKPAYAVQLAAYIDSVPYDVDTNGRGEWPGVLRSDVAFIYHYPLNAAIKGEPAVWSLVAVDLGQGRAIAGQILAMRSVDISSSFATPITPQVPTTASPVVDAPTAPPAVVEQAAVIDDGPRTAIVDPAAEIEAQRVRYRALSEGDKAAVARYMAVNKIDPTDHAAIAEAIDSVLRFADVVVAPEVTERPPVAAVLPTPEPTNGDPVGPNVVDWVQVKYAALDDAAKSWINGIAQEAGRAGLGFRLSEQPDERRYYLLAALVTLADGYDNGDAVRSCLVDIHGAELCDSMSFTLGQLVGRCGHDDAAQFLSHAELLASGGASMHFVPGARMTPSVAA